MTVLFKSFRVEMKNMLHHLGEAESFRTTGDCSVHTFNGRKAQ